MIHFKKKHHFKFKKKLDFSKHILKFGSFGFKIKKAVCINYKQKTFIKFFILKIVKKIINNKIKIFFYSKCNYNQTKLPLESSMGKGKGEISNSFGYYKAGFLFFEIKNISLNNVLQLKNFLNKKKIANFFLIY
uniref:Ribosomal protein L16 n=1 Tax=Vertebrata lanosa TaxID=1261582 RepID=A0A1J0F7J9_9FLOR|nr:ribosomal protein L16 [Vertebrata lanosa]APC24942.1 ribosomal protein L16 [Vertebrata lanosa]